MEGNRKYISSKYIEGRLVVSMTEENEQRDGDLDCWMGGGRGSGGEGGRGCHWMGLEGHRGQLTSHLYLCGGLWRPQVTCVPQEHWPP